MSEPGRVRSCKDCICECPCLCGCPTCGCRPEDQPVEGRSQSLRVRVVKMTWGGHDAHGGIPFDQKRAWRQGYDEAMRQVRRALDVIDAESAPARGVSPD